MDSIFYVGWVRIPRSTVEIDEQQQGRPRALVAIGQGMIPRKAACEYGGLVVDIGIEVIPSVSGCDLPTVATQAVTAGGARRRTLAA